MMRIFQLIILFVLITILSPQGGIAGDDFVSRLKNERVESDSVVLWEQVSPGNSGFANLLRYHPTIPNKVAFCQDMWNHYQSDNNGKRWYSTVDPDGDGGFGRMLDIEFSYSDPEVAIAIATSELWASQDTGRNFTMVPNCPWYVKDTDGSDQQSWKKKVAAVAIDPNDANTWFVAGGSNVRGQDWMSCYQDVTAANPRGKSAENEGFGGNYQSEREYLSGFTVSGDAVTDSDGNRIKLYTDDKWIFNAMVRYDFEFDEHPAYFQLNVDNILNDTDLYGYVYETGALWRLQAGIVF